MVAFFDLRGNPGGGIGGLRIMSYLARPRHSHRFQHRPLDGRSRRRQGVSPSSQSHPEEQVGDSAALS